MRIFEEGQKQEFWTLTEEPENKRWKIYCKTLYEVRIKKRVSVKVERYEYLSYDRMWHLFGIDRADIDRS